MRNIVVGFWTLIFLLPAGCVHNGNKETAQNDKHAVLKSLKIENAVPDAFKAAESQDYRFLAMWGYALMVPGVDQDVDSIKNTYGIKIIEDTTDAPENPEHARLIQNAHEYATQYNRTMLDRIKMSPP